MPSAPLFDDAKRSVEAKLSKALGGSCTVEVSHTFDEALRDAILAIDDERFREELRYTEGELEERFRRPGFTCFLLVMEDRPIAYDYGYDDEEPGVFYSDSAATLIERRGVGSTLSALEAVYCYGRGYGWVKLSTEERDEVGRALRLYWERFGFRVVSVDEDDNIVMVMGLNPEVVAGLHDRYVAG